MSRKSSTTTPRKPTVPTTDAIDAFCAHFDDLFNRRAARQAFRHDLIGLLLPRDRNKTMTVLASLVPGSNRQQFHYFLCHPNRQHCWRMLPTPDPLMPQYD